MLHYQPRHGKALRAKPRQTPGKVMACVGCDTWAYCTEHGKRMLCYTCRKEN